jgi:hypothetical protein
MNTKVAVTIAFLAGGILTHLYHEEQPKVSPATRQYIKWLDSEVTRANQWKDVVEDMVREVECIPLVGGKENRRYNRHEDPMSTVNDPFRYWYS